jgi:hypothetical protein
MLHSLLPRSPPNIAKIALCVDGCSWVLVLSTGQHTLVLAIDVISL